MSEKRRRSERLHERQRPTVFGLFDDREKAKAVYENLYGGELAKQVYLTTFFNNRKSGR